MRYYTAICSFEIYCVMVCCKYADSWLAYIHGNGTADDFTPFLTIGCGRFYGHTGAFLRKILVCDWAEAPTLYQICVISSYILLARNDNRDNRDNRLRLDVGVGSCLYCLYCRLKLQGVSAGDKDPVPQGGAYCPLLSLLSYKNISLSFKRRRALQPYFLRFSGTRYLSPVSFTMMSL